MNMTVRGQEKFLWHRNEEWYRYDEDNYSFELTDKAPKEARESFELYKEYVRNRVKNKK